MSDVGIMREEQRDFAALSSYRARSEWVARQVPIKAVRKNRGSMLVANTLVCNKFFATAFGVSSNTIESSKTNPRSPVVVNRYVGRNSSSNTN